MKKIVVITVILISSSAHAGTIAEVVKFVGGATTAFMIHEGGHIAAAKLAGTDLVWYFDENDKLTWTCEGGMPSKDTGLFVCSAGLITQAIAGELILMSDVDKDDSFWRGMMFWNVFNPIAYVLDYWFIHNTNKVGDWGYQGDLAGVEYHSSDGIANGFSVAISVLAISQGYRFIKTQSWCPSWLLDSPVEVAAYPVRTGGMITCKVTF